MYDNGTLLLASVLELFATVTATTISNIFNQVKVRKSRKQIMKSWILQKKRTKPTLDTILGVIRLFFGRIKDIITCFRDLLTFTMFKNLKTILTQRIYNCEVLNIPF